MRKAFTLVELLIVMFIIVLLVGLILPAVQFAREAARVIKCTNSQKQLAVGFQVYESNRGSLPGWREFNTMIDPVAGDEILAQTSWVYALLPYIERTDIFEALKAGQVAPGSLMPGVGILNCPSHSDPVSIELSDRAKSRAMTYIVNGGAVDAPYVTGFATIDLSVANGPFLDRAGIVAGGAGGTGLGYRYTSGGNLVNPNDASRHRSTVSKLADITKMDGVTYTLMTSENVQRGFWISDEIVHFYNNRNGNVSRAMTNNDWFLLPGQQRDAVVLTGFDDTIEGSVAFCFPRFYYDAAPNPDRMCYPRAGNNPPATYLGGDANPKQGFTAAVITPTDRDPIDGPFISVPRSSYDTDKARIPCYVGLFPYKAYTGSWYQSARPASYHAGIVVASFCDGGVRRISWDIDETAFVQLMTAGDAQSDAGWRFGNPPAGEKNLLEGRLFDAKVLGD